MAQSMLLPGGIISMTATTADRLLKAANGDAALLYLYLLRRNGTLSIEGVRKELGWSSDRTQTAHEALAKLNLVDKAVPVETTNTPPEPDGPPEYTSADVAKELDGSTPFPLLVSETQRQLGKVLSPADLKILLTIYDYLGLSAEVIMMLITWCVEDYQRKYGAGQKPRMTQLRKEAFTWHRLGVDTPDAADAHIRGLSALRDREKSILPLVGIAGRALVEGERKYLNGWISMGFADDVIAQAYETTVLKKGSLNWAYMNAILKSWHEKGLHTTAEIQAKDSGYQKKPTRQYAPTPIGQVAPDQTQSLKKDMDWMDRFLEKTDEKKEG